MIGFGDVEWLGLVGRFECFVVVLVDYYLVVVVIVCFQCLFVVLDVVVIVGECIYGWCVVVQVGQCNGCVVVQVDGGGCIVIDQCWQGVVIGQCCFGVIVEQVVQQLWVLVLCGQ